MAHVTQVLAVSERRACRTLGVARSTVRYEAAQADDEAALVAALADLKQRHPAWGYKKMTRHLRTQGWQVNPKRILRLWQAHGWQVPKAPARQRKARGASHNACHVRKATCGNQVWAVDFVEDVTWEGKKLKLLTVLDEYTREGLAIVVARAMGARAVSKVLRRLMEERGCPEFVRSDNGTEFTAHVVEQALARAGVASAWIAPGSPWQNGKNERFNGILSQELLSREVWSHVLEAQTLCTQWLGVYNEQRPHGSIGMMTPAAYARQAKESGIWYEAPQAT